MYTAAVEPQVLLDVHSLLVCGLKTVICLEIIACPAGSGMH